MSLQVIKRMGVITQFEEIMTYGKMHLERKIYYVVAFSNEEFESYITNVNNFPKYYNSIVNMKKEKITKRIRQIV